MIYLIIYMMIGAVVAVSRMSYFEQNFRLNGNAEHPANDRLSLILYCALVAFPFWPFAVVAFIFCRP